MKTLNPGFAVLSLLVLSLLVVGRHVPDTATASMQDKVKVLYHVDGKDPDVAKYAMALIHKHIEAEGGPDHIDITLVVHGPALHLFKKASIDPELEKKLKTVIDEGVNAEMCQVSMKLFGTPLDKIVAGFKPTAHPVAVKRIADLQRQGYVYIKP